MFMLLVCCSLALCTLLINGALKEVTEEEQSTNFIKWVQIPLTLGFGFRYLAA